MPWRTTSLGAGGYFCLVQNEVSRNQQFKIIGALDFRRIKVLQPGLLALKNRKYLRIEVVLKISVLMQVGSGLA